MSLTLKQAPQLQDFQQYVKNMVVERGFINDTPNKVFILINKEIGKLAQAMRSTWGNENNITAEQSAAIQEAIADVFIYLLELSDMYGISLEDAFRHREEVNKKREFNAYNFL